MYGQWFLLALILAIIEALTAGFLAIFFSIGALITAIVSFYTSNIVVLVLVFVITSIIATLVGKPILEKYFSVNKDVRLSNTDALVGKEGLVTKTITKNEYGSVKLEGQVWTAKSLDGEEIESDTQVIVREIEGVKLIVEKNKI